MNPTTDDVKRATDAAHQLQTQGYFTKVKQGDERAASYFSRLVAATANPSGSPSDWGCLSKPAGGFNIEGYADGAIVFGNNPSDLHNVLKIVTQVGSTDPNAIQIGDNVQPRRASDVWVTPVPAPTALGVYLGGGGLPVPVPTPITLPDRGEMMRAGAALHLYYRSAEGLQRPDGLWKPETLLSIAQPDWEGIGAWLFDVYLKARIAGKNATEATMEVIAQIRHTDEWKSKHPGETP